MGLYHDILGMDVPMATLSDQTIPHEGHEGL